MSGASLTVEHATVRYGALEALSDVSLTVPAGSVTAVLGPNGSGKSSMARAVSGLVPVSTGRIAFDDQDIEGWKAHRIRRAGLAYLPEGRGIFPTLSVADNLRMAARLAGNRADSHKAIERACGLFPVLEERRNIRAGQLSGGEQQMLALARALAVSPRLIIADELSLGLAPIVVEQVFDQLRAIRNRGITVVIIEQFINRALDLADHCVILAHGEVVWEGAPAETSAQVLDRYLGIASNEQG